jgi:outer membrane protein TolC
VASAQNNGLAGTANSASLSNLPSALPNPFLVGNYGDALNQVFRRNFPDYGVAVQFSIPILNRAARADVARDQLQVSQQEIRLKQLEKQVRLEIRNGAGASTTDLVIQYQRDLTQARSSESTSQGSYLKARAALDRATGSILSEHGIDFDEAMAGSVSRRP